MRPSRHDFDFGESPLVGDGFLRGETQIGAVDGFEKHLPSGRRRRIARIAEKSVSGNGGQKNVKGFCKFFARQGALSTAQKDGSLVGFDVARIIAAGEYAERSGQCQQKSDCFHSDFLRKVVVS